MTTAYKKWYLIDKSVGEKMYLYENDPDEISYDGIGLDYFDAEGNLIKEDPPVYDYDYIKAVMEMQIIALLNPDANIDMFDLSKFKYPSRVDIRYTGCYTPSPRRLL